MEDIREGKQPNSTIASHQINPHDAGTITKDTGVLLALFAVGLIIGSPVLGYLGDRMKRRQIPMLLGMVGLLGSTLLFLFASQYWELLVARFLQGFSSSCVWTLGMCLIADTFPVQTLGLQMGKTLLAHSIGLVMGAPRKVNDDRRKQCIIPSSNSSVALFQHYGYRAPFILCVALTGLDFLLRLFLVERRNRPKEWFESPPVTASVLSEAIANVPEPTKQQVSSLQLLRSPRLWTCLIIAFSQGTVFNVFEPTLTVRLPLEFGLNSSQVGLVFLAQVLPDFVSAPLAGYLTDRYGPKVVCLVNLIVCAITVALMGIPSSTTPGGIAPLIVIFALQGFSAFAFVAPVLPELTQIVKGYNPDGGDDGQARSYAFFNIAFASGALVGPIIGGYMYASIGFFWMCITMAVFLVLCAPLIYFYMGEPGKFIVRQAENASKKEEMRDQLSRCESDGVSASDTSRANVTVTRKE
ncbi:hypothetical protein EC973_002297 [Apophysomyces ossiformis]|uniref:Major facilitator superfamily (MFS) profile domain-containing protein n=1 Tax=Apophysomyces ossiformis TaxID=679940 RepID=A0A8H7BII7_9FUNG|nr:hypothetical protein EC973_002297 [Apophysomyces ossiformis]